MSDPVQELLSKRGIEYRVSGRDYVVKCLNPEHDNLGKTVIHKAVIANDLTVVKSFSTTVKSFAITAL